MMVTTADGAGQHRRQTNRDTQRQRTQGAGDGKSEAVGRQGIGANTAKQIGFEQRRAQVGKNAQHHGHGQAEQATADCALGELCDRHS